MFQAAEAFDGDISAWDVSHVTTMESMFKDAKNFNCDISKWDVRLVVDMEAMFEGPRSSTATSATGTCTTWWTCATCSRATAFYCDLTGWEMGNVEDATDMLTGTAMHSRYTAEQRLGAGHAIVDRGL